MTFDRIEKQVVVNWTGIPTDIEIDFVDKRVYWMEFITGVLKSSLYNGSDVKTVVSTNMSIITRDIDIGGDYVFCTSYYKILKIHKSSGQILSVVHREPTLIFGLLFYQQEGKTISVSKLPLLFIIQFNE
ncbi:Hypothetical predicted protein [Mytilus galloprovincialis]|uniref:Uncharacterized protein n=1 Tax=Mytilus galloprovincialis TaxID=29158 RepID=A0A8B6BNW2_MYTGA|nr:Hypothetical predicted protein [Mytilus galloprovincialis]